MEGMHAISNFNTEHYSHASPCISITTGLICTKFTNYMPSIYSTLAHTILKENWLGSS